ncbi:hypothetical protein B0J11DRAFT_585788 [Dendryphion nanum]|uniref:Cyanovirin-N domain-containing protein n=1 Tax=Dendryphion nanum TaxID=256645 RepID=A0A9P9D3K3_9PLEO|nr:hypothetical protein B0J11DRAFT_585717 [Dendryphion nanum]KAH7111859.1 hypothetical protein B0J11DRAFT_585788 [Dendryphion nanum]
MYSRALGLLLFHTRRQDSIASGLQLLGPEARCFDFSFEVNTFRATCFSSELLIVRDAVNLNQCISNDDDGNMQYQFGGHAFESCSGCTLSGTLDLSRNCQTQSSGTFKRSTIQLDGTTREGDSGVIVIDDGTVNCRAPK